MTKNIQVEQNKSEFSYQKIFFVYFIYGVEVLLA